MLPPEVRGRDKVFLEAPRPATQVYVIQRDCISNKVERQSPILKGCSLSTASCETMGTQRFTYTHTHTSHMIN